ncbi:tissue inhibitor of metalloproteinase [Ancylostoma ceylanicum]|uniref:Tissue inhibitor of metalloproteinase n=2 Tax=Ancylostoma ceylanicum TaxID=53326 RepID=A0A8J8XXS2_9BILA|nr:tissue inhibitor of metalloproteinase [Ancylostoma ceylanicum]QDZ46065.1 tissue inhibitor of metalloproteinase [Ancylostoma ceylanicum]
MLFLIVFIACFTAADAACSCEPYRTVKEAFCKSDYVLLTRVLSINRNGESSTNAANDTKTTESGTMSYNILHVQSWKGPKVTTSALTTPNSEDACGVTGLLENLDYFLTGKKGKNGEVTFTSCDFVGPFSHLTREENYLLEDLARDPNQCKDMDADKPVEEGGNTVKETGQRTEEDHDGKSEEKDNENTVEDNGVEAAENDDMKAEEESEEESVD